MSAPKRSRRPRADRTWLQDQVLATLREGGRPMNSTEIGKTVPFMFANECRKPSGKSCCHPDNGTPIGGAVVHLHTRSHTTSSSVMDLLRPLLEAGLVTREKVDQRVLWSLAPDYVREQRQLATRSAAILARELGDVASPSDK